MRQQQHRIVVAVVNDCIQRTIKSLKEKEEEEERSGDNVLSKSKQKAMATTTAAINQCLNSNLNANLFFWHIKLRIFYVRKHTCAQAHAHMLTHIPKA